eukprot:4692388-Pleurochrysis_carterae.AAC.1
MCFEGLEGEVRAGVQPRKRDVQRTSAKRGARRASTRLVLLQVPEHELDPKELGARDKGEL